MSLAEAITRAKGGDWHGNQGLIPGPGHSADDRSMSIRDKGDGDVVLYSHAGDDWRLVKDAWRADGTLPPRDAWKPASDAAQRHYVYRDARGVEAFRMVRTMRDGRKSFHAEHPDGRGGWFKGMNGTDPLPYRLPELLASHPDEPVYIVEGEKDADNLAALGFAATTNPNGAGKWRDSFSAYLKGRECVILPDNDPPGRDHADKVSASLRADGVDHVIVSLPDLPDKGDVSDWLASGGDAVKLASLAANAWSKPETGTSTADDPVAASATGTATSSHGLPLEWFGDVQAQINGLWLVKKLLPANGLALIYGHSGSSKSFLATDLAFHVAAGLEWRGRSVKSGLVIYVGAEGAYGLRNRFVALRQHHDLKPGSTVPLALIPTPINMQDPNADTSRLISAIREAEAKCGRKAVLIVIDTVSKTFGSGKENTDDMAIYVANCGRVSSEFACCVMPVHHRPKDGAETPRGHGSLVAGVDSVILVESGDTKTARVTKQKDGEEGDVFAYKLNVVTLGIDEDRDEVTSCVCEPTDAPAPRAKSGRKLSPPQALVLDALKRAMAKSGQDAPPGIPVELMKAGIIDKVASTAEWQVQALAVMADADRLPDSLPRIFRRHRDALQGAGLVTVWEDWAWANG